MPIAETDAGAVHYTHNGVRNGAAALVLIHGAGGQGRDWPMEWRYTTNAVIGVGVRPISSSATFTDRPVYTVDLPGHANSSGSASEDIGAYVRAVSAFIETLPDDAVIPVGHSLGGGIAVMLARDPSLPIAGAVIIGSAARLPVTDQILDGLRDAFEPTVDAIVKYCWSRSAPEVYRATGRRRMRAAGPEVTRADFVACNGYSAKDTLAEVGVPVLVISGEADKMVPSAASEKLAAGVAHGAFVSIPGGGHFVHVEQAGRVGAEIKAFAKRCDAATGRSD